MLPRAYKGYQDYRAGQGWRGPARHLGEDSPSSASTSPPGNKPTASIVEELALVKVWPVGLFEQVPVGGSWGHQGDRRVVAIPMRQ